MAKKPKQPARQRGPGRPATESGPDVRRRILDVARERFAASEPGAVSLRSLAAEAGVTPAMIHYYFGDKDSLYRAMLEDTIAPVFAMLTAIVEEGSGDTPALPRFIRGYMSTLARTPWLPPLILREVISEHGLFREHFIERFASRGRGLLAGLIESEQQLGRVDPDLDPSYTTLSIISLCVFPFLALPLTRELFGVGDSADGLERLITHTQRLFLTGAAVGDQK